MTYEEYRTDLTDQIGDKRAKKMVMQEIDNHIEELTDEYESSGMEHAAAIERAVEEMGNPTETGMELNKIHRPRFPYLLFVLAVVLSIFGVVLQSKIIPVLDNARMDHLGMSQTITYSVIGLGIAFLIVFIDYSVIVKHAYKLWAIYLVMIVIAPFIPGIPLVHNAIMLISVLAALFPILFAALLYRQRGEERKGILRCIAMLLMTSAGIMIFGYFYTVGFLVETMLICIVMLVVAVQKGIMGTQKKKMLAIAIVPSLVAVGMAVFGMLPLSAYQQARIDAFLHPGKYINDAEYNYVTTVVRRLTGQFTTTGKQSFDGQVGYLPSMQMHTDYVVTSMFTWFGIAIGSIVLILLFAFCVYSLYISMKQNNRISFLFGTMCSVALLIRCIFYVLNNFGLFICYSTYFPFLKYGLGNAVVNGCYIGIIMCVYRNTDILGEHMEAAKTKTREKLLEHRASE